MRTLAVSLTLLLSLVLASAVAGAQDELDDLEALDELDALTADEPGAAATGGLRITGIKGFVQTRVRTYFRDRDRGLNDEEWRTRFEAEIDLDLGRGWTGYFRPQLAIDALDPHYGRYLPLEAYVATGGRAWDVRAGAFVENWGIADTFNPVDVLNRRDPGTDFLDPERLGEIGVRARWLAEGGDVIGEPTLSVYVMPVFQEAVFPIDDSRWTLSQPPFELERRRGSNPEGIDRWFFALRGHATLDTSLFSADVQLVAARGPERTPTFAVVPTPTSLDLEPVYYGIAAFGGGIRAVPTIAGLESFTLKAEVMHREPFRANDDRRAMTPDAYLSYAFGVDRLFPNVLSDRDQLTATIEYVGETGASDFASRFRPFDDDLVLRLFWEANDFSRTSVEVRALIDASTRETIGQLIVERQLRFIDEDLSASLDVQLFHRERREGGLLSLYDNNSSVQLALRWDF